MSYNLWVLAKLPRILALLGALGGVGVSGYFWMQARSAMHELESRPVIEVENPYESEDGEHADAAAGGHGAPEGHGSPPPAHGAPAEGGHGAPPLASIDSGEAGVALLSMDEIYVNVVDAEGAAHSLAIKLDLELFEESQKSKVEQLESGIKNVVIETAREQPYDQLSSISGKLYFKEMVVTRINEFVRKGVIRSAHFASFYLQ